MVRGHGRRCEAAQRPCGAVRGRAGPCGRAGVDGVSPEGRPRDGHAGDGETRRLRGRPRGRPQTARAQATGLREANRSTAVPCKTCPGAANRSCGRIGRAAHGAACAGDSWPARADGSCGRLVRTARASGSCGRLVRTARADGSCERLVRATRDGGSCGRLMRAAHGRLVRATRGGGGSSGRLVGWIGRGAHGTAYAGDSWPARADGSCERLVRATRDGGSCGRLMGGLCGQLVTAAHEGSSWGRLVEAVARADPVAVLGGQPGGCKGVGGRRGGRVGRGVAEGRAGSGGVGRRPGSKAGRGLVRR
ncbi:hypothetical protein SAMN05421869_107172 [Nonomuraea jiangxiensis]|uniref:Uncharacterized protein n=1 Tax=Nonomuraea jiangxiensis TaxID=633440 RepID=A0A1G8NQ05_9ACTN|nr:hypothetical protein SAMN05421869_107172 [Nonomuraea jiangxiensis]